MEQKKWPNAVANLLNYTTLVFLALRACDVVMWPWWVVLSPILAKIALFFLATFIVGLASARKEL